MGKAGLPEESDNRVIDHKDAGLLIGRPNDELQELRMSRISPFPWPKVHRRPRGQLPPRRGGQTDDLLQIFCLCISHFDVKTVVRQLPFTALIPQDDNQSSAKPAFTETGW
ncbi:MAG: hypothetical protein OXH29_04745 [bacterium]|nr:hypothetical protein [bacterium]